MKRYTLLLACIGVLASATAFAQSLIDKKATLQTQALYRNLFTISKQGIMFGQQDGDSYGVGWKAIEGRSDVKELVGDYPAVHGFDLGSLGYSPVNLDSVDFDYMRRLIVRNYERGAINTISWHVYNQKTLGNSWDTTNAVSTVLPGGVNHAAFKKQLDAVADFLLSCRSGNVQIPIIFRPFHEHNGDWFWWGKTHCTEKEYIDLWRFTVSYLRDTRHVHQLIYAFSPDRSRMNMADARTSYHYAYPGDDYVDIIGLDNYWDVGGPWNAAPAGQQQREFITILQLVTQLASEKKKVAALTETGLESLPNATWYTNIILSPIKAHRDIQLAYFLVWRNANKKHHYAPYPGHPAVDDFKTFFGDPYTLFEKDVHQVYQVNKN